MTQSPARAVAALQAKVYGKEQRVRLRSVVTLARFLRGTPVRAVWCECFDVDKQRWSTRNR